MNATIHYRIANRQGGEYRLLRKETRISFAPVAGMKFLVCGHGSGMVEARVGEVLWQESDDSLEICLEERIVGDSYDDVDFQRAVSDAIDAGFS